MKTIAYPSTFGRSLEIVLTESASKVTDKESQTIREYINELRSLYDQLREVKASWQIVGSKDDNNLNIPPLTEIDSQPEEVEEEEDDIF